MIKAKTISGHHDTIYNMANNNRSFIPNNADVRRSISNYCCVAAGENSWFDPNDPRHISEFWQRYKELIELYWENRATARRLAYRRYQEHLALVEQKHLRKKLVNKIQAAESQSELRNTLHNARLVEKHH